MVTATVTLTAKQLKLLQGLYYGPCTVSASERGDFESMDLIRKGYAGGFLGADGALRWRISTRGRDYLTTWAATPSLNDDLL